MKLKNDYVIVSKDVSIDSNDNTVSILKIIDNIEIGATAELIAEMETNEGKIFNSPVQFSIASSFSSDTLASKDTTLQVLIEILSPNNKSLGKFNQDFKLNKNTDKARININIQGMPLVGSGKYTLSVTAQDGSTKLATGSTTIQVNVVEAVNNLSNNSSI